MVNELSTARADSREDWLRIGMAIHSVDDSAAGLAIWESFSRQSEKNRPGECERQWRSFKAEKTGGVSVATIRLMAAQDTGKKLNGASRQSGTNHAKAGQTTPQPSYSQKLSNSTPIDTGNKLWRSKGEAIAIFETLERPVQSCEVLRFFKADYGLIPDMIPDHWRIFNHPSFGLGIVYQGEEPSGSPCYKFKSLQRNAKGKRAICYLYGAGGAMVLGADPQVPWVIVAGEEKAAVASAAGYNALCPLTGENTLSGDWVARLANTSIERIILANDNDDAGRKANASTASALASAGFPRLRLYQIDWPEDGAIGYDLNDAVKDGINIGEMLENGRSVYPGMSSLSVLQVLNLEFPTNDNLLDDRALALGELSALIGPGGIGKSAMAFDLAVSMIMGWDWAGMQTHGAGKRWLFFQTENNARRLKSNFDALTRGKTIEDIRYISDRLITIAPLTELDTHVTLSDIEVIQRMRAEVELYKPEIIVFDPLIDFFAGDNENDAMHMRETLNAMRFICRAALHAVCPLTIHHSRVGEAANRGSVGMDAGAYGRGSKALYSAVRSQINISKGDEEEECPVLIVSHAKANNGARFTARAVKLDPGSMTYPLDHSFDIDQWREELAKGKGKGRPARLDESAILCCLEDGQEHPQKQVAESVIQAWKVSKMTAYRLVTKMVEDNKISLRSEKINCGHVNFIRKIS